VKKFVYDRIHLLDVIEKIRLSCRLSIVDDLDLLMTACVVHLRHKPASSTVCHMKQMHVCFTDYTKDQPVEKLLQQLFKYIDKGMGITDVDEVVNIVADYFSSIASPTKKELVFMYIALLMLCRNRPWWLRILLALRPGRLPEEGLLDYMEGRIDTIKILQREPLGFSSFTKFLALHTYAAEIERLVIKALGVSVTEIPSTSV